MGMMKFIIRPTRLKYLLLLTFIIVSAPNNYPQWFWQNPLPQGNEIKSISFSDSITGFIAGTWPGKTYKTTNGGKNWNTMSSPFLNYSYHIVHFINKNIGFLIGQYILKTTDGGNTWEKQDYQVVDYLTSVSFIDTSNGFIAGQIFGIGGAMILKTTDGGKSWNKLLIGSFAPNELNSVYFTDVNTGYICSADGLFKTTNGGINWIFKFRPSVAQLMSIYFPTKDTGYSVSNRGDIFKT